MFSMPLFAFADTPPLFADVYAVYITVVRRYMPHAVTTRRYLFDLFLSRLYVILSLMIRLPLAAACRCCQMLAILF